MANSTKFQKGNTGRKVGSKNKATQTLREWVNDFINDNRSQIEMDFKALEAKDRIAIFEKLLKYTLPTLQATTIETNGNDANMEVDIVFE